MRAIVFGGSGFIGGHVVEQLQLAGYQVTTAVRETSDRSFLDSLGVNVLPIDFSNATAIGKAIDGHHVVYNCTADAKLHTQISMDAEVEVKLTRTLIEEAAKHGASRFIQLSTIVIYDFQTNEPIDETYQPLPEYPIQSLAMEREKIVEEIGKKCGITTLVLRPASTIGIRDSKSFFARQWSAHANDRYPLIGNGSAQVSLVDTRDIGRAMAWLGTYEKTAHDNGYFLLKGFDTTWNLLKHEIDKATGKTARTLDIPVTLTDEQMTEYKLNPFAVKTMTVNRLWNDEKIRKLGFVTKYSLTESVEAAVKDLLSRKQLTS